MSFKKNRKIIVSIVAFILFIIVTIILCYGQTASIDTKIHNIILSIRNEKLTDIMLIITNICSIFWLTIITIIFAIFLKRKRISFYIITNLINTIFLSQVFKLLIQRNRPTEINIIEETGFSYPSGHSMISMAFFGLLAYLVYKNIANKFTKFLLITILIVVIALIGFSRIYLGVHYFSDVIGGFLISFAYLMVFISSTELKNPFN